MTDVRVRFAPSPTGYLHIGGARTALFNWLWARKHGGKLVLRIEDTDRERSTEESVQIVLDSMRWLGLDWDEGPEIGGDRGPYFQTERVGIYAEYAEKLIAAGAAYRCYATKEELAEARATHKAATGQDHGFRFQSPWRDGSKKPDDPDARHVIRFKAPATGTTGWTDLVKGDIEYPNDQQQDQVLVRPDGVPLYNFGATVDDLTMGITLVARGDDHLVNTPVQIMLYRALGQEPPAFAHLPMILGPDGQKLSKRHASVGVLEYRDKGYLPDAVINYLARLGWSHGDQEIFSREELIEAFGWDHVGATGAKYDAKKFAYVQEEQLRSLSDEAICTAALPFLAEIGLGDVAADDARLLAAVPHVKLRATSLADIADGSSYFLRDEVVFDEKGRRKFMKPKFAAHLTSVAELCQGIEPFEVEPIGDAIKAWMEANELTFKHWAQAARVALSGRTATPGLFEVMAILGKDVTVARLSAGAKLAQEAGTETEAG
ncbi:MAG: glutamate--tRNA ligase [Deltaproteobacteria bacterium]|nr:MAG: glutamate--tRNA ligase [Deltaproteobacteria bacterium]